MDLNKDDLNKELAATQSSLYEIIQIDGGSYSIPYVNGLPEENIDLIAAGEQVDELSKNPRDYSWGQASEIFGKFGVEILKKMNPDLPEREARLLSVKGNVERMYAVWGRS
jgi:hypothetical protein